MIRIKFNITSHAVFVDLNELAGSFGKLLITLGVTDFGNIVSNQVVFAFKRNEGNLIEPSQWRIWMWKEHNYDELQTPQFLNSPIEFIFFKILVVIQAGFVFAIMSILSSIALHISTISIVIFYILGGISLSYSNSKNAPLDLSQTVFSCSFERTVSLDRCTICLFST